MKKAISILLAAALTAAALTGCSKSSGSASSGNTPLVLNEVAHSIFYAPQYAAIELGYFEDEGIDLTLVNGAGADKVMTALISVSYTHLDVYKRQVIYSVLTIR